MAKLTDLTALTTIDNADLLMAVDVSDTTMAASGTNKKITYANLKAGLTGTGDVTGPASSTDNALARFDSTTGKVIQNSGSTLTDSDVLTTGAIRTGSTGTTSLLITDGDSISADGIWQSYVTTTETFSIVNVAVSGRTLQQMQEASFLSVDKATSTKNRRNVVTIFGGTNNFFFGQTLEETYNSLLAYCAARRKAGLKVIVVTMMSRTGTGAGGATLDSFKNSYNTLIRANWSQFADGMADVAANANLGADGAYANTTYFYDGIHPTTAGYAIIGPIIATAVNRLTDGYTNLPARSVIQNNSSLLGETTTTGSFREMTTIDSTNRLRLGSVGGGDDTYTNGGMQILGGMVNPGGNGGFELEYVSGTAIAYVTALNRTTYGWVNMVIRGLNLTLQADGVTKAVVSSTGVDVTALTINSVAVPTISSTNTLTNKTISGTANTVTATFNGCRAYKSGVQSIGTTLTALTFDTESYDTNTYHDNVTNNTRFTVPTTGYYRLTGLLNTDANAVARVGLRVNGSTYIGTVAAGNAGASIEGGVLITTEYSLTAGDYVELMGYFGTTQNTKVGLNGTTFSIQYLG
jgi:lysophospholipase L1-like esterase